MLRVSLVVSCKTATRRQFRHSDVPASSLRAANVWARPEFYATNIRNRQPFVCVQRATTKASENRPSSLVSRLVILGWSDRNVTAGVVNHYTESDFFFSTPFQRNIRVRVSINTYERPYRYSQRLFKTAIHCTVTLQFYDADFRVTTSYYVLFSSVPRHDGDSVRVCTFFIALTETARYTVIKLCYIGWIQQVLRRKLKDFVSNTSST